MHQWLIIVQFVFGIKLILLAYQNFNADTIKY